MKFLLVILIVRVALIWLSESNNTKNENREGDLLEDALHPAAHQLR